MKTGKYYKANKKKLNSVSEEEWIVALAKCEEHTKLRIGQKMLYGAHTFKNLGEDPIDYYVSQAYEAIIGGSLGVERKI